MDFLVELPVEINAAKDIGQRYKIQLIFRQAFLEEDDVNVPFFVRGMVMPSIVYAEIEYSDFSVAQAIEATITGWSKTLEIQNRSGFISAVVKLESVARTFFDSLSRSAAFIAGAFYISKGNFSAQSAAAVVLFSMAVGFFGYTLVSFLVDKIYETIRFAVPNPVIVLTKGDRDRFSGLKRKSEAAKFLISLLGVGVILAFIVNIAASLFYDRILN